MNKSLILFISILLILQSLPQGFLLLPKIKAAEVTTSGTNQQLAEVPSGYVGIYTIQDLNNIRNNLKGSYILMNDIDLTDATSANGAFYNNGAGWTPIGNETSPFTGVLDGNGHKIIGMKINIQSDKKIYAGLFGYSNGGVIKNLGITDSSVRAENTAIDSTSSDAFAASILGYGKNIQITNSFNTGSVSSNSIFDSYAGGVVGFSTSDYSKTSSIMGCYNTGAISAKTYAGGIVGEEYHTKITQSYNEGDINSANNNSKYAGGIVGYALGNSSIISGSHNSGSIYYNVSGGGIAGSLQSSSVDSSYNTGKISSSISFSKGGGIAGYSLSSSISNSYNTGNITSSAEYSDGGGIIGQAMNNSSVVKSYNLGDIKTGSGAGGLVGEVYNTVVAQSYNVGKISASYAGGVSGWNSNGTITDSYNLGEITGKYDTGGIAGNSSNLTIKNCYNMGPTPYSYYSYLGGTGGITGTFTGTILNSYFLDITSNGVGKGVADGTFKKSFEEMLLPSTFAGFDFTSIWTMTGNSRYQLPELSAIPQSGAEKAVSIFLKSPPQKLTYIQGEDFDVTGAVLTVKTNFGNSYEVDLKPDMVSGYDKNKTGNQSVKITYDDQVTYQSVTVVEKDITPPKKPTVHAVTDQDSNVQGEAEVGSKIEVKVNGAVIGTTTVAVNGTFIVMIPVQKAGTELSITATDSTGNVSDASTVVVIDVTAPEKPSVYEVTDKDTTVTGQAEPRSKIEVKANGAVVGNGVTGADGNFIVAISAQKGGTVIEVTATDSAGNVSEATTVVVIDVTAPEKPAVNEVTNKDTTVTGQAEPGSKVEVKANGAVVGNGVTGADGNFIVAMSAQKGGTIITVTAADNAGNVSQPTTTVVKDVTAPNKPVVNQLNDHQSIVTGEAEAGADVEISLSNGSVIGKGKVAANGLFSITIPAQKAGTEIGVTVINANGNKSEKTIIVVTKVNSGWVYQNGAWFYYDPVSFKVKIGWYKVVATWYYADRNGVMQTGWLKDGSTWYYLNSNGAMQSGWLKYRNVWYYLNGSGAMVTGWLKDGNSWYYLNGNGAMVTGWLKDGNSWYYLNGSGAMVTGWLQDGKYWYYLKGSGAMATGWVQIGNKSYYFDQSGVWRK